MLPAKQLNELLELIKQKHWSFIAVNLGEKFIPKSILKVLKKFKWFKRKKLLYSKPELAFQYGILSMALGDKRANKLDYNSLKRFIRSGQWLPLSDWEKQALELIENRMLEGINHSAQKISNDVKHLFIENTKQFLPRQIKYAIKNRNSVNELITRLVKHTGNWTYDFGRMADYCMHEAYDTGRAMAILRSEGSEAIVYKRVHLGACQHCMKLYNTYDRKTKSWKPKEFKLSELIKNGTNIGRKTEDWKPVIGATHPWCRCDLEFKPKDTNWSENKKRFIPKLNTTAKRLNLSKFMKVTIEY